jgi:ADP-ribosylglycohydrolase
MAIASGVISSLFYRILHTEKMSKKEIVQYMIDSFKAKNSENSIGLRSVELGVNLAKKSLNPIIVYSSITGFTYNELMTLLVYSFLYFDDFETAFKYIAHTTGDNDSLGFMLGALFGAFDGRSLSPAYLDYIEAKDVKLIN